MGQSCCSSLYIMLESRLVKLAVIFDANSLVVKKSLLKTTLSVWTKKFYRIGPWRRLVFLCDFFNRLAFPPLVDFRNGRFFTDFLTSACCPPPPPSSSSSSFAKSWFLFALPFFALLPFEHAFRFRFNFKLIRSQFFNAASVLFSLAEFSSSVTFGLRPRRRRLSPVAKSLT